MPIGVSTACLYPMETEKALRALGESGVRTAEIFLNSWSELSESFVRELSAIREEYGMRITSVHPFTSGLESYMLFSGYMRRFQDCREIYKKYATAAAALGAKYIVLHGDRVGNRLPVEEYCRRFLLLQEDAAAYGAVLLQENVNKYRASAPEFIETLRRLSGDAISFVFDIKQSIRAGFGPKAVLDAMDGRVAHVHISDHSEGDDCLLPGRGACDFRALFSQLTARGYAGDFMIEVYRDAFSGPGELSQAAAWLKKEYLAVAT